jgi:hypothetical protein
MSDRDDDFLARWSRRKRAARSGDAEADAETQPAEETAAEPDPQPPASAATEPPEPLPRLEDLTAGSDLAAFLREGVPAALRNAAMRKMWSLDPVVRDYIGPSEYAWDFNQPGSMGGFGALGPAPSVAGLFSTARRVLPEGSSGAAPEPEAPSARQVADDALEQGESSAPAEPVEPSDRAAAATAAEPNEETDPAASSRTPLRPRHGGALPR